MKDEQYPCQTGCRRTLDGHSGWVQAETMGASRGVSEVQGPRWHRLRGGSVPARGYREGSRRNAEGVSLISRYKQTYQVTPPRRTHGRNGSTGAERWASLDGRKRKMGGSGHSGVPLFRGGVGLRGGGVWSPMSRNTLHAGTPQRWQTTIVGCPERGASQENPGIGVSRQTQHCSSGCGLAGVPPVQRPVAQTLCRVALSDRRQRWSR